MIRTLILVPVLLAPAAALAGPLTPPAGPVAPTMKTLGELDARIAVNAQNTPGDNDVIPSVYKISQPGTYYLAGHLTGQPGKATVEIAASDVTLDLNGFTITGGAIGVFAGDAATNTIVRGVTVRNGSVRNAESFGVTLSGAHGGRLENLTATGCAGTGLRIGQGGTMVNCSAVANLRGFDVDPGAAARGCGATGNTEDGFLAAGGSVLIACTAQENGRYGFIATGADMSDCTATGNAQHGFSLVGGAIASRCRASGNGANGLDCGGQSVVDRCVASSNAVLGIRGNQGTRIEGCATQSNGGDGIQVQDACMVVGNICIGNGVTQGLTGAGVRMMGTGNQVVDNQLVQNEQAVATAAGAVDNFIARNIARGNQQGISAVAGNELAPVIANPGSNGFSTATPWSNFVY